MYKESQAAFRVLQAGTGVACFERIYRLATGIDEKKTGKSHAGRPKDLALCSLQQRRLGVDIKKTFKVLSELTWETLTT